MCNTIKFVWVNVQSLNEFSTQYIALSIVAFKLVFKWNILFSINFYIHSYYKMRMSVDKRFMWITVSRSVSPTTEVLKYYYWTNIYWKFLKQDDLYLFINYH